MRLIDAGATGIDMPAGAVRELSDRIQRLAEVIDG